MRRKSKQTLTNEALIRFAALAVLILMTAMALKNNQP